MSASDPAASPETGDVTVRVPARPEFVQVVRVVASSVAVQCGVRMDELEDLRLAVDEACGFLVRSHPGASTLTVTFTPAGSSVSVAAAIEGGTETSGPSDGAEFLTWHLLGALTDGARFERGTGGPTIRFEKAFTS